MTTSNPELPGSIDKREFSISRKGYDKREVRAFLGELEAQFHDLEEWAHEATLRLQHAEFEAQKVKDAEVQSVDAAIAAVLESKDRILERARKRASEIESGAQERADAILDGVGVAEDEVPLDLDAAKREAAEIVEHAQREVVQTRSEVEEAKRRLEELLAERNKVRDEIEALIAGTLITESDQGVEIDPVGTLRRVEEQSMEMIADAEVAADRIRADAQAKAAQVAAEIEVVQADAQQRNDEAEERVQDMLLMAEEAAERSIQSADAQAEKRIEALVSESQSEAEDHAAEALSLREEARTDSENIRESALEMLAEAESIAEKRLAEIVLRVAESENLSAMALEAEQTAAETLQSARAGAEALREEAQEFREEAKRKKREAKEALDQAESDARQIVGEAEHAARLLMDDIKDRRAEGEAAVDQIRAEARHFKASAESDAAEVKAVSEREATDLKFEAAVAAEAIAESEKRLEVLAREVAQTTQEFQIKLVSAKKTVARAESERAAQQAAANEAVLTIHMEAAENFALASQRVASSGVLADEAQVKFDAAQANLEGAESRRAELDDALAEAEGLLVDLTARTEIARRELEAVRQKTSDLRVSAMADVVRMSEQAAEAREQSKEAERAKLSATSILESAVAEADEILSKIVAETEAAEACTSAALAAQAEADLVLQSAKDEAELIRIEYAAIQEQARSILGAAGERTEEGLVDSQEVPLESVEAAQQGAVGDASTMAGQTAASAPSFGAAASQVETIEELQAEVELVRPENAVLQVSLTEAEDALTVNVRAPAQSLSAGTAEPRRGGSLRERIDAAQMPVTRSDEEDSFEAIRRDAMHARDDIRALLESPDHETLTVSGVPITYERASTPATEREGTEERSEVVESRYSRHSAKLPRLGIEPDAASDTIAELRKQMTADDS